jgi:hypothetical protein
LWVENPLTGGFVPVRADTSSALQAASTSSSSSSAAAKTKQQQQQQQQQRQDDDRQLENTPLIPKLSHGDIGTGKETLLFVPPHATSLKDIDEVFSKDEWTKVRMEYKSFSFVKRLFYLFFQVRIVCFLHCMWLLSRPVFW